MAEKPKNSKERVWTETELKYLALVLADEKTQFAVRLDTLALKKSSNNEVFEDISKAFESCLSSNEFKEENEREKSKSKGKRKDTALQISPARLRVKYKWFRNQWRKFTDRVKKGSGKAPIQEPEWFTILNPIFSDTMGDMNVASCPSDVLSHDREFDYSTSEEESELEQSDKQNTSNQDGAEEADNSLGDSTSSEASSNSGGTKRKIKKPELQAKPCSKKRVRSQTQAIQEMAKSFSTLGELQQKRSEMMTEADKEKQAEFFKFQREQAELNRQHELKMMEIILKFTHAPPPVNYQHAPTQVAQQPTTHSYYNSGTGYNQLPPTQTDPSQMADSQVHHLTDLDYPPASSNRWY